MHAWDIHGGRAQVIAQPQRRLNRMIKDVVRKEVIKCLDVGIVYSILDNKWVSPVQCVPKKKA